MGWTHYDETTDIPNTIADLTNAQLQAIGDEYTADRNKYGAYVNILGNPLFSGAQNIKYHVSFVYETLDRIQLYSKRLMNEQVPINTSPLTYNTRPVDVADLISQLEGYITDPYLDELNTTKLTYGCNQMVAYSKVDGTGDWSYYSIQTMT